MVLLRYRRGTLLAYALLILSALIPFVLFFLHPETIESSHGRFHRLLSSDFGRTVFIPGAIGACLLALWGLVGTLLGSGIAIEAEADAIVVTGLWRRKRIAWERLGPIEVERTRTVTSTHHRLIFRGGGRTAKVPLGITRLGDDGMSGLLARIEAMRRGAGRPPGRTVAWQRVAAPAPTGFGRKGC